MELSKMGTVHELFPDASETPISQPSELPTVVLSDIVDTQEVTGCSAAEADIQTAAWLARIVAQTRK